MSESEDPRPPSEADPPDRPDSAHEHEVAALEASHDHLLDRLGSCEPKLRGPEIPNAEVSENGIFTIHIGDTEVFESVRVEFFMGMGLDDERPIEWLWPERIPLGVLTVLEGASHTGKSLILADMAARVSRGAPWPGRVAGPNLPGEVLFLCGDFDDWKKTVFSRLKMAGADVCRIGRPPCIETYHPHVEARDKAYTQRRFSLPGDLGHLEYSIRARPDVRLVVIDSLAPFCANDKAYRETLRQLNEIAARRNVAIVVASRPVRKRSRNSLVPAVEQRADAVRCAFNTLPDLQDETLCYLAPARMNFAAQPQWLPYRIGASGIVWEAPVDAPPEASGISEAVREKGALRREAAEWLRGRLSDGPESMMNILRQAKALGYSLGTLRRVKAEMKVRSTFVVLHPGIKHWNWELAPDPNVSENVSVETAEPVAEASVTDEPNGKSKSTSRRKSRGSKKKAAPVPEEHDDDQEVTDLDFASLENLDNRELAGMMTPKFIRQIITANRGNDEIEE